jgi:hypothetical protein
VKTRGFFRFERDFIDLKQIPAQKRYRDDVSVFKVVVILDHNQSHHFIPVAASISSSPRSVIGDPGFGFWRHIKQIPAQKRYRDDVGVFKVVVTLDHNPSHHFIPVAASISSSPRSVIGDPGFGFWRHIKQIPAQKRYRDDVGVFKVVVILDQAQLRYVTSFNLSPQPNRVPVAVSICHPPYPFGCSHFVIPEICYWGSRFWFLASYKADPGPEALPG